MKTILCDVIILPRYTKCGKYNTLIKTDRIYIISNEFNKSKYCIRKTYLDTIINTNCTNTPISIEDYFYIRNNVMYKIIKHNQRNIPIESYATHVEHINIIASNDPTLDCPTIPTLFINKFCNEYGINIVTDTSIKLMKGCSVYMTNVDCSKIDCCYNDNLECINPKACATPLVINNEIVIKSNWKGWLY